MTVFAELLTEVNKRQELRTHDHNLINWAWANIAEALSDDSPPQRVLVGRLRSLLGLDDALDALILGTEPRPAGEWKPVLRRLRKTLAAAAEELDREVFLHPSDVAGG
jgi:hypothetical protein